MTNTGHTRPGFTAIAVNALACVLICVTVLVLSLLCACSSIGPLVDQLPDVPPPQAEPTNAPPVVVGAVPVWNAATLASCWDGNNAEKRMMNMLSPRMSQDKFDGYSKWMAGRGVNTAHVFVGNKGDGENAGYCIYGSSWDWSVDTQTRDIMRSRILSFRARGWAVVIWLMADDSSAWNKLALADPERYLRDVAAQGLLDHASTVVVGLELTEYANRAIPQEVRAQVVSLVAATRKVYPGMVGVHHGSGRLDFASLGDILFYQIQPGASASTVKAETRKALATGKPVNFFELSRNPNRPLCEAAMKEGAYAVGNW